MSRQDIGEKPDHQGEGLREDADDFDERHQGNGLQEQGHVRPENVLVIVLVAEQVDGEESEQRQGEGHGDVAGDVGSARKERDDAEEVVDKNEEKGRQQIGAVALVIRPHTGFDDVIFDHHHQHFHQTGKAARRLFAGIMPAIPADAKEHEQYQDKGVEHQSGDILRDADIQGADVPLGRVLHDFSFMGGALRGDEKALVLLPAFQMGGRETMPATLSAIDDDGQRNGNRVAFHRRDMPLIGVHDMAIEVFVHVQGLGKESTDYVNHHAYAVPVADLRQFREIEKLP